MPTKVLKPSSLMRFLKNYMLPIAIVGYVSGKRQGEVSAASIGLVAKRPDQSGKAIIFPAMVETYAILALLVSILAVTGATALPV